MSVVTEVERDHDGRTGDGFVHVVHACLPDIAFCGSDRSGRPYAPEGAETTCAVCAAMECGPCPHCGALP